MQLIYTFITFIKITVDNTIGGRKINGIQRKKPKKQKHQKCCFFSLLI